VFLSARDSVPLAGKGIMNIVSGCAEPQVFWIDAAGNVAAMKDKQIR
jgi:hypothetical protein